MSVVADIRVTRQRIHEGSPNGAPGETEGRGDTGNLPGPVRREKTRGIFAQKLQSFSNLIIA